ncbi:DNA cytosine methyltransferase [Candidatus Nanohalococcus occultus]|uniref:DNA (cytosine-5-)-methyltransferase n=1 Tax=Candidatus Nanohalococcus occultus TaxID=2978047 RepID=A0ABY8CE89_9ARCH|nr:Site-specific DNA methylase [Candidatus Nanohaloarchaeota archaeon SVXNc]
MSETDDLVAAGFFVGCGGLDLGIEKAGFEVVIANDYWEPASETYQHNFEDSEFIEGDIRDIGRKELEDALEKAGYSKDDIDVVVGGPPCQGFSRLNNENIELDEMEKDDRNTLFQEFLRVVDILRPDMVLMENVRDLINRQTSEGEYIKDLIVEEFNKHDYKCEYKVLEAQNYGVPQKRKRIFFIGTDKDVKIKFPKPSHPNEADWETAGAALENITDDLPNMRYANTQEKTLEKIRHVPPGGYYDDLPDRLKTKKYKCDCEDKENCPHEKQIVKRYGTYLRRLHPDEPSLTVSNNPFIHPEEDRYITPREKARLQTFPDSFEFTGNKGEVNQQLGNAVPVELGRKLGEKLKSYFPGIRDKDKISVGTVEQKNLADIHQD